MSATFHEETTLERLMISKTKYLSSWTNQKAVLGILGDNVDKKKQPSPDAKNQILMMTISWWIAETNNRKPHLHSGVQISTITQIFNLALWDHSQSTQPALRLHSVTQLTQTFRKMKKFFDALQQVIANQKKPIWCDFLSIYLMFSSFNFFVGVSAHI